MLEPLKKYIKASISNYHQLKKWEVNNRTGNAPHSIKQKHIKFYQTKYNLHTLVETGTYMGDMVFAMRNRFKKIYSIELSSHLFALAIKRFQSFHHINLLEGDSGIVLHDLVPQLTNPTLYWLDGHYSGGTTAKGKLDCPIFEELNAIFRSSYSASFIILIDDARLFVGQNDYPTLSELEVYLKSKEINFSFSVIDDIIHINLIQGDHSS